MAKASAMPRVLRIGLLLHSADVGPTPGANRVRRKIAQPLRRRKAEAVLSARPRPRIATGALHRPSRGRRQGPATGSSDRLIRKVPVPTQPRKRLANAVEGRRILLPLLAVAEKLQDQVSLGGERLDAPGRT